MNCAMIKWDATDRFGALLRSKYTAYIEANCSCEVQRRGVGVGGDDYAVPIQNRTIYRS